MTPPPAIQHRGVGPLPARRRFSFFVGAADADCCLKHFDDATTAALWQDVKAIDIGGLAFMWVRGNAIDVGRIVREQHKDAASHPLYLLLKLNTFTTNETNDVVLVDADRFMRLQSPHCTDMWFVGLSRSLVSRWLPSASGTAATLLKGHTGWPAVLSAYLHGLDFHQLQSISSPFEKELMAEHVLSMLSFALPQNALPAVRDPIPERDRVQHDEMHRWILDNYADPEISVARLAKQFHASVRHVHKVFASAGHGMSFLDTVRHVRLETAARMLRAPAPASMLVAQIAYRCGFADAAYFGLVFRKRYGCTPRTYAGTHALPQVDAAPVNSANGATSVTLH
jgi:AraC-like DNA-binding protein